MQSIPRPVKRLIAISADMGGILLSTWAAYCLRSEGLVRLQPLILGSSFLAIFLAIPIFARFGLYLAIFRQAGWNALSQMTQALAVFAASFVFIVTVVGVGDIPRAVGVIQPLLLAVYVVVTRVGTRFWLGGGYHAWRQRGHLPKVLIYGAGSAGRQLASGLKRSREYRVVGFLDDDQRLHGNTVDGWMVHDPAKVSEVVEDQAVSDVLLAVPTASRQRTVEILGALQHLPLRVRTLPGLTELASGRVSVNDLRDLDIEDLLGRDPVKPNGLLLNRNTRGKTVLVTGAGGSIGSELCRQILKCEPARLLLLEVSEFALYRVHQDLLRAAGAAEGLQAVELIPLLGSVGDEVRVAEIMDTWRPDSVYHAAAYKHVPLVEHNPSEGVRNNVWGTMVCARSAARFGVNTFVLISTDKAVRPTNVMGASKRLAEMVLQALAALNPVQLAAVCQGSAEAPQGRTQFSMVRFGNVLGSSGSVVPLFRQQIRAGGPVTVTHADITRYFMSIPEAAQLVVQAGAMTTGGDVFVLDMGNPVKVFDLARRMVELSGLTVKDDDHPDGDIEIQVTGLRPGEKLYEELLIGDRPISTQHPRIMKAQEEFLPWARLQEKLAALDMALNANDVVLIKAILADVVQGYQPAAEVVDWVYLAQEREAEFEMAEEVAGS